MLLENIRYLVTQNKHREIMENVDVRLKGTLIRDIDTNLDPEEDEKVIDCSGKLVMPGLINCHTHVSMTIFRGISDDKPLEQWLHEDIFPAEEEMTEDDVYQGARMGIEEMLRTGTTCFNDMYAPEEPIAKAVDETGIRAVLAHGFLDADGEDANEKLVASQDFIEEYLDHPRITPAVAPHAVYTCSRELLWGAKEQADEYDLNLHIHLSETEKENADCIEENGSTPTQYLDEIGVLGDNVIAAHATHLTDTDIRLLAENEAAVAHNPCANLKLGSGLADIPEMKMKNVATGVGTDGVASNNNLNLFEEIKFASLLQKEADPTAMDAQKTLDMVTCDAAEVLGMEDKIGSVEQGKKADLVSIDLDNPELKPVEEPERLISHLVFSFSGQVNEVIVDGKILRGKG